MKRFIIIIIAIIVAGCKTNTRSVAVFFNASGSLNIETYHLKVVSNNLTLLDTAIKNEQVDRSDLVKCIMTKSNDVLHVIVNGKELKLLLDSIGSANNCISLFIKYNDRIKLRELYGNYTAKSIKQTGTIPDYNRFVDSLTAHRANKYDSLLVEIKNDKCKCN